MKPTIVYFADIGLYCAHLPSSPTIDRFPWTEKGKFPLCFAMALRLKVLRTKAEKFERKEMLKYRFNLEQMSALESMLLDVYLVTRPKLSDYEVRKELIRVFNEIAKEIYGKSNDSPLVEEFGSFSMDLFSTRSDLDMSVNFTNNGLEITREKKIQTLRKFAKKFYALQSKGHVTRVHPITTAKVPILKVVDRGTGVECDLSVENRDGIVKSQLIHMICSIDERFRKLSFLMKTWARAQNINSSKDGTLNSLSIILLVAFHLQTRTPPILPPFTALFKDGTDLESVVKLLTNFVNYGKDNRESVAELFVTLLIKLSSIERLWSKGLCVSVCDASWKSKTWDSKVASISVEDFTDRSQNVSRAVGATEMKLIYKCIHRSIHYLFAFNDGHIEGSKLRELLFGQDAKLPLLGNGGAKFNTNAAEPGSIRQTVYNNRFGQNSVTPKVDAISANLDPNVAQPCIPPHSMQTKGVQIINDCEESQKAVAANSLLTKRLLPLDGWDQWRSVQQIEQAMPFEKMQHTEDWIGIPSDSWERLTSANLVLRRQFPGLEDAQQPVSNCGSYVDGWGGSQRSLCGDANELQQTFALGSFSSKESRTVQNFGAIHEGAILTNVKFPVAANSCYAATHPSGSNNQGSTSLRISSVKTNHASFNTADALLQARTRHSKKRKRFR